MAGDFGEFRLGEVFRDTALAFRRVPLLCLLCGVLVLLPALVKLASGWGGPALDAPAASAAADIGIRIVESYVLYDLLAPFAFALSLLAVMRGGNHDGPSISQTIRLVCRRYVVIFALFLLVQVTAIFGLMLLVVPGLILVVRWAAAIQICIFGGAGVMESLRRSAALTKGFRWKLLGLFVLSFGVVIVTGELGRLTAQSGGAVIRTASWFVLNALGQAFNCVVAAATYHRLRIASEGTETSRFAGVFD